MPLASEEFERDYLAGKIKGHTELIEMIDDELIPGATSDAVKRHAQATRDAVAGHLDQLKALRPAMNW
ncbi:MAG: DUF4142 domain-containing protein [Pseudomonadota bacterium]|nr:DUF4142 domain-containing protein [Pseudomonadota bacterium]